MPGNQSKQAGVKRGVQVKTISLFEMGMCLYASQVLDSEATI